MAKVELRLVVHREIDLGEVHERRVEGLILSGKALKPLGYRKADASGSGAANNCVKFQRHSYTSGADRPRMHVCARRGACRDRAATSTVEQIWGVSRPLPTVFAIAVGPSGAPLCR